MDTEYNIAYKKIRPDATAPACHKDGRVLDIYAAEDVLILPGETVTVGTGLAFVFPDVLGLMFMPVDGLSSKSSLRYAERAVVLQNNYYKQEEVKIGFYNTYSDEDKIEMVPEYRLIDGSIVVDPQRLYAKGTVKICKGDCISRMMPVDAYYEH